MSVVDAPRGGAEEGGPRPLDTPSYADIMSDMKTFTVRELDRSPGVVLEASRIEGKARIRARGGQTYIIMPEPAPPRRITSLPNFAARRAALLAKPLSPEFTRKFDRRWPANDPLRRHELFFARLPGVARQRRGRSVAGGSLQGCLSSVAHHVAAPDGTGERFRAFGLDG